MVRAYIGLGSNLDDPLAQIRRGFQALGKLPKTQVTAQSRLYESKPLGPVDQPDYINAVAAVDTCLIPRSLLSQLQQIEHCFGRLRTTRRWGPRILDLDILLYGDEIIDEPELMIPHPGLTQRDFVLYPLQDIDPQICIPGKAGIKELIRNCPAYGLHPINV